MFKPGDAVQANRWMGVWVDAEYVERLPDIEHAPNLGSMRVTKTERHLVRYPGGIEDVVSGVRRPE